MEILVENVGEDPIEIDADNWDLTRYRDANRPSEFKIDCSRRVPVKPYARVIATDGGETLFRGYIQRPKIKNINQRELNCKGEEDLLLRRHTGRYSYAPDSRVLAHAFASDAPSQTADAYDVSMCPGLLWIANSIIPFYGNLITTGTPVYDWYYYGSDNIYKLAGLGSDSRIGTSDIYMEGLLLPRQSSFANLQATALSCYSDANDLWVRCDNATYNHGFGPQVMLCADDAYATGVEMGSIANSDTYLKGNFQCESDRILDILIDLAEFHNLIPFFRYEADHTYFDVLLSYPENEFFLPEDQIKEITQSRATDLKVHALIGRGMGSRDAIQRYAPSDHAWKGVWYQETYDANDTYLDTTGRLKTVVDAEYHRRLSDEVFTVKPLPEWPFSPLPGDMVDLALIGESEKILQVASRKTNMAGDVEVELGARKSDIMDAFNAKSSLSKVYSDEYLTKTSDTISGSGTMQSGDLTHGWCTGYEGSFTVPDEVRSNDWSHRVFLGVTITSDSDPEPMDVKVLINDTSNQYTSIRHYLVGDSISDIDITRLVEYGSISTIKVYIKKKSDWPDHANCTVHPEMNLSYTVTCYRGTEPWTNPEPPGGAGYYVIRPVATGDVCTLPVYGLTDIWQYVDDDTPDEDVGYISAIASSQGVVTFDLTPIAPEDEYGSVTSVTVVTRCRHTAGEGSYLSKGVLLVGGNLYYGENRYLGTAYQNYYDVWTTNPYTGVAWTWGDIRDLQAGFWLYAYVYMGGPHARCTQMYVIVNYE